MRKNRSMSPNIESRAPDSVRIRLSGRTRNRGVTVTMKKADVSGTVFYQNMMSVCVPNLYHCYQRLFSPRQQCQKFIKTIYIKVVFCCLCNNFQLKLVLV